MSKNKKYNNTFTTDTSVGRDIITGTATGITGNPYQNINIENTKTSNTVTFEPVYYDQEKCSKCKVKSSIKIIYNWSDNEKLKRYICKKCYTKTMDKLFELDNNIDSEEVLYGPK